MSSVRLLRRFFEPSGATSPPPSSAAVAPGDDDAAAEPASPTSATSPPRSLPWPSSPSSPPPPPAPPTVLEFPATPADDAPPALAPWHVGGGDGDGEDALASPTRSAESSPRTTPRGSVDHGGKRAGAVLLPGRGVNYLELISRRASASDTHGAADGPSASSASASAAHSANTSDVEAGEGSESNVGSASSATSLLDVLEAKSVERDLLVKRLSKRLSFERRRSSAVVDATIFAGVITSRYRILEKLGTGGFADVYKIQDRSDASLWALKVVYKNRVKSQHRLDQEIEALKRAQHPNIVCLREVIAIDSLLYLRQDLAAGGCLFDLLVDVGGFGETKTALVMKHIFEAVAYLHSIGIVHRDIKLENILLGRPNDLASVKLADFGVARIIKDGEEDRSNGRKRFRPVILSHVGSVAYMAPEIFLGTPYDEAVDMWACGVMLFMLLSLSSPFGNDEDDPGAESDQIARITKADFDFSDPAWQRRSDLAKGLCRGLLKFDPNERLTAKQALQHEWVLTYCPPEDSQQADSKNSGGTLTRRLNDGRLMPVLGLGVYQSEPGEEAYGAVLSALQLGYRHVDTAELYGNEADVGRAVRDSGVAREDVWVTTKLWNSHHAQAERTLERSLQALGMTYVDLYLIHSPLSRHRRDAWRALERLQQRGLARSIGVSNYGAHHLDELLTEARVVPAVNQCEIHPFLQRADLVRYCESKGIVMQAYSPLTKGRKLKDPTLVAVAQAHGKTAAQVLVRWSIQKGFVTLPKSVRRERLIENMSVFDWSLTDEDMLRLGKLEAGLVTGWDPVSSP